MNLLWVVLVTATSVILGTWLCFWIITRAQEIDSPTWIFRTILCPVIRIMVLFIIVSQVYPAIDANAARTGFWSILFQQRQFSHLINILFFAGLLLSFIPVLSHPVFALPIQSILTIALVFHWQYADSIVSLQLFPSMVTILKIAIYMMLAFYVTRESSRYISHALDTRFAVTGSIRLVSDAIYLVLQIPVILVYSSFLKLQLP